MQFKRIGNKNSQKNLFFSEQVQANNQASQQIDQNTQPTITSSFLLQDDLMDESSAIDPVLSDNIFDVDDTQISPSMISKKVEILDEATQSSSPMFPHEESLSPNVFLEDSIFPEPSPSPKKPQSITMDKSVTASFTGRFHKMLLDSMIKKQSSSSPKTKIQKPQKTKQKYKPTNLQIKSILEYSSTDVKPMLGAGIIHDDFEKIALSQNQHLLSQPKTSTQDFEITSSGNFAMGGIKIGANGIIDFGQLTLSQSQASNSSFPGGHINFFKATQSTNNNNNNTFSQSSISSPLTNSQIISYDTLEMKKIPKFTVAVGGTPHKSPMKNTTRKPFKPLPSKQEVCLSDLKEIKTLGTGASSIVTLVKNSSTGEEYAIKALAFQESTKPKWITTEIKSLHKLRKCPYVLSLYDAFFLDNKIQILMEKMDGSLEDFVKRTKSSQKLIPESILACISLQVLRGLYYLHTFAGGVHRDIKPANILYKLTGQVKISDFGLTGLQSSKQKQFQQMSQEGRQYGLSNPLVFETCQGTLLYMSPERIKEKEHGSSSDIWSFGVTLLELALGEFPWKSLNMFDVLQDTDRLTNVKQFNHLLSPLLISFLERMLQVEPNQRSSAAELLNHPFIAQINQTTVGVVDRSVLEDVSDLAYEISTGYIRQWLQSFVN